MSTENQNVQPVPGWVGGFAESNPSFSYPNPDLSSLPMLDNMDNIDLLQRQQGVKWPEFSWETELGKPESRCFQMFAPFISRLGYTNEGRVYSIICPQQGFCSPHIGSFNVEVTVTGQRGWVNENTKRLACDMTVVGKIWFGPSAMALPLTKKLEAAFQNSKHPFPSKKEHAIQVKTHMLNNPNQPIFPVRSGENKRFISPEFARHEADAWDVANIDVEIGGFHKTDDPLVDEFNELIMWVFNLHAGNMLQTGNTLTWNVWFTAPTKANQTEWREHAQKWRDSIDADHGSPTGQGSKPRFFDGRLYTSELSRDLTLELEKIEAFLKKYL